MPTKRKPSPQEKFLSCADGFSGTGSDRPLCGKMINRAGFVLKNTLSDNGGVTRGICKMDENGNLTEVVETKNIVKTVAGAEADGVSVDVDILRLSECGI